MQPNVISKCYVLTDSAMPQLSNKQQKKLADAEMKTGSTVEQLIKKTAMDSMKGAEEWEREYAARKEVALVTALLSSFVGNLLLIPCTGSFWNP